MATPKSRSQRMASLESLASNEAKELAAQMAHQSAVVLESESKLSDLETYLRSYQVQQEDAQSTPVNAMQLMEKHAFLKRLEEAVRAQQQVAQAARSRYELLRAQWLARHLRSDALGKAVHRFQLEEDHDVKRREQGTQDEIAARNHRTL